MENEFAVVDTEEVEQPILDIDAKEDTAPVVQYDITSYGADLDVTGLVRRLRKGDIFVPEFQRDYVWSQVEASKLVESLLLGLPIPGIFLAKEGNSNKLLVIDGQQRLKSLQFFYEGYFNPKEGQRTRRIFKLLKVQSRFDGKTYEELEENDKLKLDDSIIHATIIKQESPAEDNTAVYHVFERLNSGGKKLSPQEIRSAVYYGALNNLVSRLNMNEDWREIFGPISPRLKDEELILRFLAVLYDSENYSKPMNEFLNRFNMKYRNPSQEFLDGCESAFTSAVAFLRSCVGRAAFRPEGVFNVSVFESITVATARLLGEGEVDCERFKENHGKLIADDNYRTQVAKATSDESVFQARQDTTWKYLSQA